MRRVWLLALVLALALCGCGEYTDPERMVLITALAVDVGVAPDDAAGGSDSGSEGAPEGAATDTAAGGSDSGSEGAPEGAATDATAGAPDTAADMYTFTVEVIKNKSSSLTDPVETELFAVSAPSPEGCVEALRRLCGSALYWGHTQALVLGRRVLCAEATPVEATCAGAVHGEAVHGTDGASVGTGGKAVIEWAAEHLRPGAVVLLSGEATAAEILDTLPAEADTVGVELADEVRERGGRGAELGRVRAAIAEGAAVRAVEVAGPYRRVRAAIAEGEAMRLPVIGIETQGDQRRYAVMDE